MEFVGAAALEQALRDLGDGPEIKKALGGALLEAGEPMAKAMRARAPRGKTGEMAEGIDVSKTLSRRQRRAAGRANLPTMATVYVGPKPKGLAVLVEFGTMRRHWKTGKSTGSTAAHPFARPGFEQEKIPTLERYSKLLWIQIEKAAARIAKRQTKASK